MAGNDNKPLSTMALKAMKPGDKPLADMVDVLRAVLNYLDCPVEPNHAPDKVRGEQFGHSK